MRHKKGKPPHARGGPKWNKPWKMGRFGRGNPEAEAFSDHRRRAAADDELQAELPDDATRGGDRLFKLVRAGPLMPAGSPIEIVHLDDGETEEVQPMAPQSETLLGYLVHRRDGTLGYEEVCSNEEAAPDEILAQVYDILGPGRHAPLRGIRAGGKRPGTPGLVYPREVVTGLMLNYIHGMGNHLAALQWRELDAADR